MIEPTTQDQKTRFTTRRAQWSFCPFCGRACDYEDRRFVCDNPACLYPLIKGIPELHETIARSGATNEQADAILEEVATALLDMQTCSAEQAVDTERLGLRHQDAGFDPALNTNWNDAERRELRENVARI